MTCFRGMTFCASDCTNRKCHRNFSLPEQQSAESWWGGPGAPVAMCDFSKTCGEYARPTHEETERHE